MNWRIQSLAAIPNLNCTEGACNGGKADPQFHALEGPSCFAFGLADWIPWGSFGGNEVLEKMGGGAADAGFAKTSLVGGTNVFGFLALDFAGDLEEARGDLSCVTALLPDRAKPPRVNLTGDPFGDRLSDPSDSLSELISATSSDGPGRLDRADTTGDSVGRAGMAIGPEDD